MVSTLNAKHRYRAHPSQLLATALIGVIVASGAAASGWILFPKPTTASTHASPPNSALSTTLPAPPAEAVPRPDCRAVHCVALTFDDGPDRVTTSRLLDLLEERRTPATFFVLGYRIAGNEDLLHRMVHLGMGVENHTWDHPNLTHLTHDAVVDQIRRTNDEIVRATGRHPEHIRPPGGNWIPGVTPTDGLALTTWDVDPRDWFHRHRASVVQNTLSAVRPGSVVLLHDIHPSTIDAVPGILDGLKSRGLVPATLRDLNAGGTLPHE